MKDRALLWGKKILVQSVFIKHFFNQIKVFESELCYHLFISSCGKEVRNLKIGDRIAIEPGYSCRECEFCKSGSYNICRDMKFCATPPIDGNLR